MHLHTRNVNTAFRTLVEAFHVGGKSQTAWPIVHRPSRNGDVLVVDEPVTITYSHPTERVLFNTARNANPWFHLYHSLWLLAGRNDVAGPTTYAKQFARYSDDGKVMNGSYGHRWRHAWADAEGRALKEPESRDDPRVEVDQLDLLVAHLRADPTSRRAMLQMWNVEDDLLKIGNPCPECAVRTGMACGTCGNSGKVGFSRDVACNLSVLFSIRRAYYPETATPGGPGRAFFDLLDVTVLNRSNDLVWGLTGEDYCTFSFLQEYMAARLGIGVGRYHHVSNNLHVYTGTGGDTAAWRPNQWLADNTPDWYTTTSGNSPSMTVPLVKDPAAFERELPVIVERFAGKSVDDIDISEGVGGLFTEPFFRDVADPLLYAHALHRSGFDHDAFTVLTNSEGMADDWRICAEQWLSKRVKK